MTVALAAPTAVPAPTRTYIEYEAEVCTCCVQVWANGECGCEECEEKDGFDQPAYMLDIVLEEDAYPTFNYRDCDLCGAGAGERYDVIITEWKEAN